MEKKEKGEKYIKRCLQAVRCYSKILADTQKQGDSSRKHLTCSTGLETGCKPVFYTLIVSCRGFVQLKVKVQGILGKSSWDGKACKSCQSFTLTSHCWYKKHSVFQKTLY